MLSELIISETNKIIKLRYNSLNDLFVKSDDKQIKGIRKILKHNDNLLIMRETEICLLDEKFDVIFSAKYQNVGSIYTVDDFIYVGADGSLICLDGSFNELSRVKFNFGYMNDYGDKNIDHIFVYNNIAYLIDDVVQPLFIFKVDVSDKNDLKIIDEYSFESLNAHLSLQLINPECDQWIVKEDYGHMGGSGESLHVFSLFPEASNDKGVSTIIQKASRRIFSWTTFEDKLPKGYRVKDITTLPPHWSVMLDEKNNVLLCKINTKNERIRFSYLTLLIPKVFISDSYWYDDFDYALKQNGNSLFISEVSKESSYDSEEVEQSDYIPFWVFDVSKNKPRKINEDNLANYGINSVKDFIVIA